MMVVDFSLHEAIDEGAFADSAVSEEDHLGGRCSTLILWWDRLLLLSSDGFIIGHYY